MVTPTKPRKDFTLPAASRIKSKKVMDRLFEKGTGLWQSPFRMVFTTIPYNEEQPVRMAVSAPKRKMKKAVDRNRMKRLMREAFRLNKQPILDYCRQQQIGLAILFISQCNTQVSFRKTEDKIIILLRRLTTENAPTAKLPDDRNDQVL